VLIHRITGGHFTLELCPVTRNQAHTSDIVIIENIECTQGNTPIVNIDSASKSQPKMHCRPLKMEIKMLNFLSNERLMCKI